jgi:hypothetical protein
MKNTAIKLFEEKEVRSIWNEEEEKWCFSVVDIIQILTENNRPRKYWSDLKTKLKKEGSEVSEKIGQLKLSYFSLTPIKQISIKKNTPK